jgi:hypothetical protein
MVKRIVSGTLSVIKALIGLYLLIAGAALLFTEPLKPETTDLGIIYENHWSLIVLGIIIALSGLTLFVGEVLRKRRVIGHGLFACYMCLLFAGILNWVGLGWQDAWPNLIAALIVGALYLRWKYRIYYPKALDNPFAIG